MKKRSYLRRVNRRCSRVRREETPADSTLSLPTRRGRWSWRTRLKGRASLSEIPWVLNGRTVISTRAARRQPGRVFTRKSHPGSRSSSRFTREWSQQVAASATPSNSTALMKRILTTILEYAWAKLRARAIWKCDIDSSIMSRFS